MKFFDTHAHYEDRQFQADRDAVLSELRHYGVSLVVSLGSDIKTSRMNVKLAEKHPFLYAAVGIHPHQAKGVEPEDFTQIESWLSHKKVKALGEIGLDYHYDFSPREKQQEVFRAQMEMAQRLRVPVVIHDREAHQDSLQICKEIPVSKGVFHCYSGSAQMARELLDLGYYLSFTGSITFRNARKALEVIEEMPLERLMIETDAPYLTPEPFRGKRNTSAYVYRVAEKIAEVRRLSVETVARITMENGKNFFSIDAEKS